VNTNKYADILSVYRPMTAEEKAYMLQGIEDIYSVFIGHVANGRGMTTQQVDDIGQGRVWSGINAMQIKLIDEFGGLERAIELAAEKAGLENYRITELPKQKDPFEILMESFSGSVKAQLFKDELGMSYKYYDNLLKLAGTRGIIARIPYEIEVY